MEENNEVTNQQHGSFTNRNRPAPLALLGGRHPTFHVLISASTALQYQRKSHQGKLGNYF